MEIIEMPIPEESIEFGDPGCRARSPKPCPSRK
jgi:hypothetical protein